MNKKKTYTKEFDELAGRFIIETLEEELNLLDIKKARINRLISALYKEVAQDEAFKNE